MKTEPAATGHQALCGPIGALALALLLALTAGSALASDAERDKQMKAAQSELDAVRRELARVASDKSDGNVERALAELDDVEDAVGKLKRVADGSAQAEEFVDTYTDNHKKLAPALRTLGEMEDAQTSIDKLPATCRAAEAKLEGQIEALVRVPEDDDEAAIEKLASQTGSAFEAALDKADRLAATLKSKNSQVGRVSFSDPDWRDVGRTLDRAGDDVLQYYERSLDAAHRACDGLAQPMKLPSVVAALSLLHITGNDIQKFLEDGEAWFDDTRAVFRINCEGLDEIRLAYCAVDHGPGDGGDILAKKSAWPTIMRRIKDVRGNLDPLLTRYQDLSKTGEAIKRATGNSEVAQLLTNMGKRYRGLVAIRDGALLKGSRNPWLQTWQDYGVKQHEALTRKFGCDEADKPIPGSNLRPDCFVVSKCMIVEFKPEAQEAKNQGDNQLDEYTALLQDYFEELLEQTSEAKGWAVSGAYGGSDVLAKLIDAGCVDDEREQVTLTTGLATYDRCDRLVPTCPDP